MLESSQSSPPVLGAHAHFEHHRENAGPGYASARFCSSKPNGSKGRLDGIRGSDVLPMRGRKVIECQENPSVFGQAISGLGVFLAVGRDEAVERLLCLLLRLGHPNGLKHRFSGFLRGLGQFVEDVGRFVHPAPLLSRLAEHFGQCLPKPQGAVANGQCGPLLQTSRFQVLKQLDPVRTPATLPRLRRTLCDLSRSRQSGSVCSFGHFPRGC